MQKTAAKRWSARFAAATMIAAGAALLPTVQAQAATPGVFSICNNGTDVVIAADLPPTGDHQGWGSRVLTRGECVGVRVTPGYIQHVKLSAASPGKVWYTFNEFDFSTTAGVHVNVRGTYGNLIRARS